MTLKVGELQADITGDTSGLETAKNKATQLFSNIEKRAKSAEVANSHFWNVFGTNTKKGSKELEKFSNVQNKAKATGSGLGRGVGQLGIQVGQFVGMVQGGSNALLAFSYQASDMAIVLGMMLPKFAAIAGIAGALISIGSALAGSLLPALFNSKSAVDKLQEATKKLGEVAKSVGNDGLVVLTDKVAELAKESEDAAKAMLIGGIDEALKIVKASAKEAQKELENVFGGQLAKEQARSATAVQHYWKQIEKLANKFRVSGSELHTLSNLMSDFNRSATPDNLAAVQDQLDKLAATGNSKMAQVANKVREFSSASKEASEQMKALKGFMNELPAAVDKAEVIGGADPAERLKAIEQLGETEREAIAREYAEREKLILASTQLTEEKRNELLLKAAEFRNAQLAEIAQGEQDAAQKEIDQKAAKIEAIKQLDESERERIMREFYERKEWILAQTQISEDELSALVLSARNKRDQDLQKIRDREIAAEKQKAQDIQQNFKTQMTAMQGMTSAIGNIMEASGKSGAQRFAATISGISQMAIQIITMMQAQATAQAAADPSAMTLPQKIGNIAMMGSIFAGIVSMVSSAKGGGRQRGGMTSGNLTHEVNERGPELLTMGNRQYLMPTGQNGKVSPLSQSKGAGGNGIKVTVINNANNAQVRTEQVSADEVKFYVDSKIQEVNASLASGRGTTAKSLQQGFQTKRRL